MELVEGHHRAETPRQVLLWNLEKVKVKREMSSRSRGEVNEVDVGSAGGGPSAAKSRGVIAGRAGAPGR